MTILAKFRVTERREVTNRDPAPTYLLEAVDDDESSNSEHFSRTIPQGKIRLRVDNPRAQKELDAGLQSGDDYYVEITKA